MTPTEHIAYLSLGTNLGNKEENLRRSMQLIEKQVGRLFVRSAFYVTAPWGFHSENTFLNNAVGVRTVLAPLSLLEVTQQIEQTLGRTCKSANGVYHDRPIDIDILFYDDLVTKSERLTLPHPLLHQRTFVLEPMNEIAPDLLHPVLKKDIHTLIADLQS